MDGGIFDFSSSFFFRFFLFFCFLLLVKWEGHISIVMGPVERWMDGWVGVDVEGKGRRAGWVDVMDGGMAGREFCLDYCLALPLFLLGLVHCEVRGLTTRSDGRAIF